MTDLKDLGWSESYAYGFEEFAREGLVPGRVSAQEREGYRVLTEDAEWSASVTGRFHHTARHGEEMPAVGDWVAVRTHGDFARIHAVLARRTVLRRKLSQAGIYEAQVVAANVDIVFLAMSANRDFNLRRMERLLTLVWESGAHPVVLVTKTDLVDDAQPLVREAGDAAYGVPVLGVSVRSGEGLAELRGHTGSGRTVVLVGSSGVGKSTLTNHLLGSRRMRVQAQRDGDDRGRHTTTTRELFLLPGGGCVIDTPGLRAVALWGSEDGLDAAFRDIEDLAGACRFSDCRHESEPGGAVREGVESDRLASYHKLQRELAHVERKQNRAARNNTKRKWKAITREMRRRNRGT